ncbi:hypothetical protein ROU88_08090 [Macrococcus capreoli]|uniref:hypothetical protein n=1 Tax=Macrococcus capreoli TaxID=2982690 RepID=UPI003EE51AF8
MIPKYTKEEIVTLIHQSNQPTDKVNHLKANNVWTLQDYELASQFLNIEIEALMAILPDEDLSSISFRASQNNDAIQRKVQQVNHIFDALTYQLKIGGGDDRKI